MLIGDTTYDILMARAAGAVPVGVSWGNHPAEELVEAGAAGCCTASTSCTSSCPKSHWSLPGAVVYARSSATLCARLSCFFTAHCINALAMLRVVDICAH